MKWVYWACIASGSYCFAYNIDYENIMGIVGRAMGLFVLAEGIIFVILTELKEGK